jgi:hypothetical protein
LLDERQVDPLFLARVVDWPRRRHFWLYSRLLICSAGEEVFAILGINRD